MSKVNPIPEGYTTVTPYLALRGAAQAIEFYKKAFGATEVVRMPMPGGLIGHAELQIGNARIMLADESPDFGNKSAQSYGGSPIGICLYVEDCDKVFYNALQCGATSLRTLKDQFYGDRSGTVQDPYGYWWTIATHIEDVTPDEMKKRMAQMSH